ncbi:MAG: response regulator [Candidatus Pacebacteria bacterium]|nr:response regulator [Candidatus Paceibacterota bacterium]
METLRLLVVDDELGMRLGVEKALRQYTVRLPDIDDEVSYEVEKAEDGKGALAILNERPPDLLLLDHKLPDITGLEILDKLNRGESPETLTIMITAYASLETAVTATKRGAFDFLAKPFTPTELKSAVRKATRHLVLQREARRLAEEKRQIRFQFISVLTHEMKAPLGAVEGYLRIMKERAAGDDPAVYDQMLDRSLVRLEGMRKLIFDLLDMTAIESGQRKRELQTIDLKEAAERAVETFLPEAEKRDITLELHAPDSLLMTADRSELDIVLNNLVSNAIKYNKDGGRVDVTLSSENNHANIEVKDTGIGMKPENAEKLFKDFVRIKNSRTRRILGSGLGLSTVKKIANLYNGDATVHSEEDVGSTFIVTLQRTPADQEV